MGVGRTPTITPEGDKALDQWLDHLDQALSDPSTDRFHLMRQTNLELVYGDTRPFSEALEAAGSMADRIRLLNLDANNVTLEPEIYSEMDVERFAKVKPLLHAWQVFDASPLGANVYFGQKFRYVLAKHVFKKIGKNVKIFRFVEFSFGYNISCGDNVVFHRFVLLDDRAPVTIGDNASMADFVNIYSHTHDVLDQGDISCMETTIGAGARLTYHSTLLAGANIGEDAMLGSFGLATRSIPAGQLALGIPAKVRRSKNDVREERSMPARDYPGHDHNHS